MTEEEREAWREKERAYDKAYRQTPEYKAYQKARNRTPEYKAYEKARYQTPEYKARYQTPEYKARKQTPEYKAYQKAYNKAYRQTITKQKAARNYMTALFAAQQFIQAIETKPNHDK